MSQHEAQEPSALGLEHAIHGQSVDWHLQKLVALANESGLEMGLTLVLGGSVVSGTLISGRKYFEAFGKEFADAWNGADPERLRESFASHGEIYDYEDADNVPLPQYLHLQGARVHFPGGNIPSNRGVLWRGKINAVSGFCLGSLSPDEAG